MRDGILTGLLLLSFATLVTTHVAISARLASRDPRWRAALAFFVPPFAPIYALREGWRRRATLWLCAAAVYALSVLLEQI